VQQLDTLANASGNEGAGRTRLWLASAPSGSGKTALACHFAERWLASGRQEDVAVVALASELLAAGGSLKAWWSQRFGKSPAESCADAAGNNLILYVDGLDRLGDPDPVVDELAALVRDPALSSLRVIAASTEAVADRAVARLRERGTAGLVHRWSMPPLNPPEARRLFELLGAPGEEGPRLDKEVEPLLTTPLLVRLARSLGEQETAVGLTPGRLLRAHADRTVLADPVRAHVALRLVERILEERAKSIPLSTLINDPSLRSSLLATGEDAPLRALVREHVLLLDRAPTPGGLPTPSEVRVSFAFDAQLDYLAFASMAQRFGTDPAGWRKALCGEAAPTHVDARAATFGPLVGGLRVFAMESLMSGGPEVSQTLAELLAGLPAATARAVLAELLASGLDAGPGRPLEQFGHAFRQLSGEGAALLADAASGAFSRLVMAGRTEDALAATDLAGRVVPGGETVSLRAHATRFASWSNAQGAVRLGRALVADARRCGDPDAVLRAVDALREALGAAGMASQDAEASELEEELLRGEAAGSARSDEARVAVALAHARRANANARNDNDHEAGVERDRALAAAAQVAEAGRRNALALRVALVRSELYADKRLNKSREERQEATRDAVDRACALGDPFVEALACDLAAWSWHMDLATQSGWVERGLLAASATRAEAARARLLDRRGRAYFAQGRAQQSLEDAAQAAEIFDRVGHRRAALRVRLHVGTVASAELGRPGEASASWPALRAEAEAIGATFEHALCILLEGLSQCDLGRPERAAACHAALAPLAGHLTGKQFVQGGILAGRVARLEGRTAAALEVWREAGRWGQEIHFPDFVYPPPLLAARARLDAGGGEGVRAEVVSDLRQLLELRGKGADRRPRYAGEIYLLLARALTEGGRLQEAGAWLAEALAVQVLHLLAQHQAVPDEGGKEDKAERRGKKGFSESGKLRQQLDGRAHAAAETARALVAAQAASFPDETDRAAFVAHHEATRLLVALPPKPRKPGA